MGAISSQYQLLLFLRDLECLHIRLTLQEFQAMNKIGIIHQLLKNHSHEPKVKSIFLFLWALISWWLKVSWV